MKDVEKRTTGDTDVPQGIQECGLANIGHTNDKYI